MGLFFFLQEKPLIRSAKEKEKVGRSGVSTCVVVIRPAVCVCREYAMRHCSFSLFFIVIVFVMFIYLLRVLMFIDGDETTFEI